MNAISPDRPILSADDFDDYDDDQPRRRWLLLAGIGAATLTLAAFAAVAVYGWLQYGGGEAEGPVPLVQADTRPSRVRPDNPGGMTVPNMDRSIYDTVAGQGRAVPPPPSAKRVENLLPPPEAPMPRPVAPPPEAIVVAPPPVIAPAPPVQAAPILIPPPVAAIEPSPAPVAVQPAPPPAAAAVKPAARLQTGAAATGFRIQLAALRSTDEATQTWDRLRRAHPGALGGLKASVVRIDLGEKGTFYRLQAGPLADRAAATDVCAKLARERSACLVVPPS